VPRHPAESTDQSPILRAMNNFQVRRPPDFERTDGLMVRLVRRSPFDDRTWKKKKINTLYS
jgi:hypothetical protein